MFFDWVMDDLFLNFDSAKVWEDVSTRTDMANPRVYPLFLIKNESKSR
jgi:hypothetical protein